MSSTHLVILTDNEKQRNVPFLNGMLKYSARFSNFQISIFYWQHTPRKLHDECLILNRVAAYSYDDQDLEFEEEMNSNGHTSLSRPKCVKFLRSKIDQFKFCQTHQIATIETIQINNILSDHPPFPFPLIIKTNRGEGGYGVECFKEFTQYQKFTKAMIAKVDSEYIIQPFVTSKREIRLFTLRGEILWTIEKKTNKEQWKHNLSNSTWSVIDSAQLSSINLNKITNLSKDLGLVAWDFLHTSDDKIVLLEINLRPGLNYLEKSLSKNPFQTIIEKLVIQKYV